MAPAGAPCGQPGLLAEQITHPMHRAQQLRCARILLQLLPQLEHMRIDGAEWASLAEVATAAILRTGPQPTATADWLLHLTPAARTPLAMAVVNAPARRTFSPALLRAACEVLTVDKDARHLALLQALLDDPRAEVRIPLAKALATTFDRRAAQPLLELLKDDDLQVQQVSREQLQRLAEYLQARSEWEQKLK